MQLKEVQVSKKLANYKQIKQLYKQSFPKDEKFPFSALRVMTLRKNCHFVAYYDGDEMVGITYSIVNDESVLVLYLAVSDAVQSRGYGSQILQQMKDKYTNQTIYLNIQPVQRQFDNYKQRVRRLSFYQQNEFQDIGYTMKHGKVSYTVLAYGASAPISSLIQLIKETTHGIGVPHFHKDSSMIKA